MANPLPNEEDIYQKIETQNLKIDSSIWELIDHHIRNDLQVIAVAISNILLLPNWFIRLINSLIKLFYKLAFQKGTPPDIKRSSDKALERIKKIDSFLRKLKKETLTGKE